MPAIIWWPLLPAETTLHELAARRPDARLQAAMACNAADYRELWDELAPGPSEELYERARGGDPPYSGQLVRSYYTDYLETKCPNIQTDFPAPSPGWQNAECWEPARRDKEPTTTMLSLGILMVRGVLVNGFVSGDPDESVYPGRLQVNAAEWELFVCVGEDLRRRAMEGDERLELYPENGDPPVFDSGSNAGVDLNKTIV